jgi:hypothetical protein
MSDAADRLLQDAIDYAAGFDVSLSDDAREVIWQCEDLASSLNDSVYDWTLMTAILRHVREVRSGLARLGVDPDYAFERFLIHTRSRAQSAVRLDPYDGDIDSFSKPYRADRQHSLRAAIMDFSIESARSSGAAVTGVTLFDALVRYRQASYSDDEFIYRTFNTLTHFIDYDPSLLVKFADIREQIGLHHDVSIDVDGFVAPAIRSSLAAFRVDHPIYERNCFLVMPFSETKSHRQIADVLRRTMRANGFNLVRADDHAYSEDLLTNVQAYLHGCRFGIAVFERILSNDFNPNVSLEVGYLLALRKPICLLKERTLPRLPSDLVGRLYVEFDNQDIDGTLPPIIERWLRTRHLLRRAEP